MDPEGGCAQRPLDLPTFLMGPDCMDSIEPTATLVDARGMHCPVPVIELSRAIDEVRVGDVVEILSDDPSSRVDIPVWCRMKRHDLVETRQIDGAQSYLVRRTA